MKSVRHSRQSIPGKFSVSGKLDVTVLWESDAFERFERTIFSLFFRREKRDDEWDEYGMNIAGVTWNFFPCGSQ
jgi:hypothetical protein